MIQISKNSTHQTGDHPFYSSLNQPLSVGQGTVQTSSMEYKSVFDNWIKACTS